MDMQNVRTVLHRKENLGKKMPVIPSILKIFSKSYRKRQRDNAQRNGRLFSCSGNKMMLLSLLFIINLLLQ